MSQATTYRQHLTATPDRGAHYTPPVAANFMANWVLEGTPRSVLEPSFGNGSFINAIRSTATASTFPSVRTIGVEIDQDVYRTAIESGLLVREDTILGDFLSVPPFPVDAVIGNPPFVRFRNMDAIESTVALQTATFHLGNPIDPSGSIWMSFVLHASSFVRSNGRLALVLPFDATYVRYARPMWNHLAENFGNVTVIRVKERLFPDLLQDVILVLAGAKGSSCQTVQYCAYLQATDLLEGKPAVTKEIPFQDIASGKRPFIWAHISPDLQSLLNDKVIPRTIPVRSVGNFNIGYVSGDKRYFHPSPTVQEDFKLPEESLIPTVTSSRKIRAVGLHTSAIGAPDRLFFPSGEGEVHESSIQHYIKYGEIIAVDQKYKCRTRSPWYQVPYVKVPDVILTTFSERPVLLVNDANLVASNSFICGYLYSMDSNEFAARWYTSLTLLYLEAEVHALGGGVMVLVPRETGNIHIVDDPRIIDSRLDDVNSNLLNGDSEGAYRSGDRNVLGNVLGLSSDEIDLIQSGVDTLAHWRKRD